MEDFQGFEDWDKTVSGEERLEGKLCVPLEIGAEVGETIAGSLLQIWDETGELFFEESRER